MPSRFKSRSIGLLAIALAAVGLVLDFTPAEAQTTASVTLLWTAPGDDGQIGRASRYDVRYSSNSISGTDTLSWWNAATILNLSGKVPSTAGATDSTTISGLLTGRRYYAIVRAADEVPNWSGFSNVAVIDLLDQISPARIADLRVR